MLSLMYGLIQQAEAEAQRKIAEKEAGLARQARLESQEIKSALMDAVRISESEKKVAEQLYLEAKRQEKSEAK